LSWYASLSISRVSGSGGSPGFRSRFFSGSVESAVLTTARRLPSGAQARPSTSLGRSVSWRASPPSANGSSQTWVPPSSGASALPGLAPPPPAWRTAARSDRNAMVRPLGLQRGLVSLLLPTVNWRAGALPSVGATQIELR